MEKTTGPRPSPPREQMLIAACFLVSLVLILLMLLWLHSTGGLYPEDVVTLMTQVLGLYATPFGVILGGMFARKDKPQPKHAGVLFLVAIALVVIWNLLILWRTAVFVLATDGQASSFAAELTQLANASLFLVSGMLAYYFAK
ncbi:MAG: hypothetical protein AAGF27_08360 [Pseudomonadota bacterium]